jgi:hypothetical protein
MLCVLSLHWVLAGYVADSETTIFDVGANARIDAAAFDYLRRLVPTDVLAVSD